MRFYGSRLLKLSFPMQTADLNTSAHSKVSNMDNTAAETISVALVEDHDLTRMGLRAAFRQAGLRFLGEADSGE